MEQQPDRARLEDPRIRQKLERFLNLGNGLLLSLAQACRETKETEQYNG